MNIKSYFVYTTASSVCENGYVTILNSQSEIKNRQLQLFPNQNIGSFIPTTNCVIRSIEITNNSNSQANIQIIRKDSNGNAYFNIRKTLQSKEYATLFSGYSVLNAGHKLFVKSDQTNLQVILSVIEL